MKQKTIKHCILIISLLLFVAALFFGMQLELLLLGTLWMFAGNFSWLVFPFYLFMIIFHSKNKYVVTLILSILALFFAAFMTITQINANIYFYNFTLGVYFLPAAVSILLIHAYYMFWRQASGKQKTKLYIYTSIVLLIAIGFYYFFVGRYLPKRNPHPKYFVTIKGKIDPKIKNIVKLKWVVYYGSSVPQCDTTYNYFEGTAGARRKIIDFIPKVSSSGKYEIKIPIDKYKLGFCHWQLYNIDDASGVYHYRNDSQASTFAIFYPCGHSVGCSISTVYPKNPERIKYRTKGSRNNDCHYNQSHVLTCNIKSWVLFSNTSVVPRNGHYTFIENYNFKN